MMQGMVAHACNPSTWEAEVQGQSRLHSKMVSKKKKVKKKLIYKEFYNEKRKMDQSG
jgi:hypothetical protein